MSTTAGSAAVRYQGTSSSKSVNARYRNNSDLRLSSGVSSSESPVSMQFTDPSVSSKVPADVNNRRDTKAGKDDEIIAVKDAEYIDSFPVVGEDQASKTEYIRKYLLDIKNTCRTRPIQLIISLYEIRICDAVSEVPMMTHVLKRIAFATCSPEYRHFSFVAREPKGSADDQYCHAFLTKTAREAEELNRLVAAAFSAAYAHSQSSSATSRESAAPPTSLPGPTLPQSSNSYAQNPPLTPMPISGSPALTFQDMLRGAHRDRDTTAFSYAPPSSSSSGPVPLHSGGVQQQETGSEELATRLQQISTASVDLMVVERRQRRSADSVGSARAGTEEVPASTHVRSSAINSSPTASQKVTDSSPISRSSSTTKSPLQNSNGCALPTTTQNASCITACSVNDINNAFDTMLLSNLLRTLKFGGGGDTRPHGSPVMILKELIDFHFINRAFNEDQSANDNGFMPTKLTSASSSFQLPTFSFLGSRQDTPASSKKNAPSAAVRPRPLSGLFSISNGDSHVTSSSSPSSSSSFNKVPDADATIVSSDSPPRLMESPRNGCDGDGDLTQAAWYQPGLPRETVLEMLIQQDVGAFVVRDSTTHAGCYALSIRVPKYENESGISHYLITRTPRGTVKLKGMAKEWLDLTALVTHHTVMRELLPCLLVMPRTVPITGVERYDRANSVC